MQHDKHIQQLIQRLCPNGVEFRRLGEIGRFYGGLSGKSKKDFTDGNAKFITYMNVYKNPALRQDCEEKVKIAEGERQNTIQYKDVLFTGSSETPEECGMTSVVTEEPKEPLYLNSFCFGLRLNDATIFDAGFLKHLFRSKELRKQIVRTANGVTRFNVSKKLMEDVEIPLPPLEVQGWIAGALDRFTELEAELEAELDCRKRQYAFYRDQLLTFPNGGGTQGVTWKKLGEIGEIKMCKRIMKNQTSTTGDVPFYKIGTFGKQANAYISQELYEKYRANYPFPQKGDVLISAAGTIGRAVIYDGEPAYFQDSNIVWIDNDESVALNKYLFYLYGMIEWQTDGGTIKRLYNDRIRETRIAIPPLAEQERIVGILDRFERLTTDLQEGLPAEIRARRRQYEHYRDRLLSFGRGGAPAAS